MCLGRGSRRACLRYDRRRRSKDIAPRRRCRHRLVGGGCRPAPRALKPGGTLVSSAVSPAGSAVPPRAVSGPSFSLADVTTARRVLRIAGMTRRARSATCGGAIRRLAAPVPQHEMLGRLARLPVANRPPPPCRSPIDPGTGQQGLTAAGAEPQGAGWCTMRSSTLVFAAARFQPQTTTDRQLIRGQELQLPASGTILASGQQVCHIIRVRRRCRAASWFRPSRTAALSGRKAFVLRASAAN